MDTKYWLVFKENVPRWYGLSWSKDETAILLKVSKGALKDVSAFTGPKRYVEIFKEKFEFVNFEEDVSTGKFGFDRALEVSDTDGTLIFKAVLPPIVHYLDQKCNDCEGSGESRFNRGMSCISCGGKGMEREYKWNPAFAISASLNLIFRRLYQPEVQPVGEKLQLLTVTLVTDYGQYGGALSGAYSIPLVKWLSSKFDEDIPEMVDAMRTSYERFFGKDKLLVHTSRFGAFVNGEGGGLNVDCPGDACGLNPSSRGLRGDGRGYEFSCHNVDSPAQQLTLLAGLAALHDAVERELVSVQTP